jgi:pantothenate kinase type III
MDQFTVRGIGGTPARACLIPCTPDFNSPMPSPRPTIAVDIGNGHLSLHWESVADHTFDSQQAVASATPGGKPVSSLRIGAEHDLEQWFLSNPLEGLSGSDGTPFHWWICSVCESKTRELLDLLRIHRPADHCHLIDESWIPMCDRLLNRQRTGIDRLVAGWYVGSILGPELQADSPTGAGWVVVDAGSAVTVDWVDATGCFRGGMIYPGWGLSARALKVGTAALPEVQPPGSSGTLEERQMSAAPPKPLGRDTVAAIEAGLFWSQWGGLQETVHQQQRLAVQESHAESLSSNTANLIREPIVVVTGGGARNFIDRMPHDWIYRPELLAEAILALAAVSGDAESSKLSPQ